MSAQPLLAKLQGVRGGPRLHWRAICPAHESKHRTLSLAVRELPDGTVLIRCHAGCGACDVVAAVGLELRSLFPDHGGDARSSGRANHWHAMREAVQTVEHDLLIVAIAAEDVANGCALSLDDVDLVAKSAGRIRAAIEACR